ncbi:AAA family ATPase, partial [candidate division WOR-3 bacterium]|nr:AAA family ATPase [candidate division WOR-3 bacterium]
MTNNEFAADLYNRIKDNLHNVIIGQDETLDFILITLMCNAHSIIVGVPGLAKTLIVKLLAMTTDLSFNRIQFTPDLMPSDILGTVLLKKNENGETDYGFVKGPVFCNILLADEINRTPPKTQAALLQAMEERMISIEGEHYDLTRPFNVFATQNPIEQEGTYPLPEAQ